MRKKFGFDGITKTAPDKTNHSKWHVAIELQGPNHRLIVGSLFCAYGHYIEDIASGKGYLKGPTALRETSFDQAVQALERAWKWWVEGKKDVRALNTVSLHNDADKLVGVINGLWLALACGVDPIHSRLQLLIASTQHDRGENAYVSMLVRLVAQKSLLPLRSLPLLHKGQDILHFAFHFLVKAEDAHALTNDLNH